MKRRGLLIYLIGISGSGKSTIANALYQALQEEGVRDLQLLDGDTLRSELGNLFGYTREERLKNNRVVRVILKYLLNNGIHVVLSQVAPYEEIRQQMRAAFGESYIEVYVKCSVEECARRDVKGYYKNQTKNLNGLSDEFELPENSEIVIDTEKTSVQDAVAMIMDYLRVGHYEL